jgi:hypothetical protein
LTISEKHLMVTECWPWWAKAAGPSAGNECAAKCYTEAEETWLLVRRDGAGQLDVRITIKTDDEALIYMRYEGILAGEALPRVLGGEAVPPAEYYFRTTPYFETSSQKYAWLNKIVAVGVGQVELSKAGSVTKSTRLSERSTSADESPQHVQAAAMFAL